MLHRALAALVAVHFALYQTFLVWTGLAVTTHLLSDIGWLLSAAYAGEIVGGYWLVQGGFALIEKVQKAKQQSGNRSLD